MTIEGKVVAITGTSGGIGRAVAEVFASRGALVVGCGRRSDKGATLQRKIADDGGTFTFVTADVTIEQDCGRFIDVVVEEHGRIDVLINNAGGGGGWVPTDEVSEQAWDDVMRLNLYGALFCSQHAIRHMKEAGRGGVLLHVSSVQGVLAVGMNAAYNAAKAAEIHLSNTLAVEYLADGIRSNVIVMGGAPTAAAASAVSGINQLLHGREPNWGQHLPPPITGTPLKEIGDALAALADDDCRAITGAVIALDQAQSAGALYSEAIIHALSGGWEPRSA